MFQTLIDKVLLRDNDKGSYSLTFSVIGFIIINIKLLFAGTDVGHVLHFSEFSGTDYGVVLAAISALHLGNKAVNNHIDSQDKKETTKITVEETKNVD